MSAARSLLALIFLVVGLLLPATGNALAPPTAPSADENAETRSEVHAGASELANAGLSFDSPLAAGGGVKFGQASVKSTFAHGPFAGQTIGTVAKGLRSGKLSPDQLPIEFIVRNGERVALNNRSLTALRRAGMQPTKLIDRTGIQRYEQLLDAHLRGGSPSDFMRIRGGPPGTSLIE